MDTLSLEESRELLALCKAGKLYQVEEWIQQGKSIRVHPKSRDEPLHVALRKGFFSLIELLARHTDSQQTKDQVLLQAVRLQQFDTVKMLVDHGADSKSVPFDDVLCAWDPEMMRYFLANGVDVFDNDSLARALTYKIQTALGFFMDCKRAHPERVDDLQRQLDMALAIHCREGDEKWVSMLMWAGGNPHAKVRDIECKKQADKPWAQISGAEEAARKGHVQVLEMLDLTPTHPDAQEILNSACTGLHDQAVHYLLKLGIDPNDKENGGASGLDTVLVLLDWGKRMHYLIPSCTDTADKCLKIAKDLIRHKARWAPDAFSLRRTRKAACEIDPERVSQLVGLLARPGVCSSAMLQKLVGHPKMQDLLKRCDVRRR